MTRLIYDGHLADNHRAAREQAVTDPEFGAWIGGASVEAASGDTLSTVDPADGEAIADVPACTPADVQAAVDAAEAALEGRWGSLGPGERAAAMADWVDVLRDHEDELVLLESLDTGKPIEDARGEVVGALDTLDFYAGLPRSQRADQIPAGEDLHVYTRHEPFGVVGQIVPWNFPAWAAAWKLGPALAAGNATVLKPSSSTPLSAVRMAQLSQDVLPDGVVNVVPGTGRAVGGAIAEQDRIRKISFTGSVTAGQSVMEAAADHVAPVTLELGGKSPFIVFPDADLDKVVDGVAAGVFYGTGQICDALSRALVHEDLAQQFTDRFVAAAEAYTVGDPLRPETDMGPLTTAEQYETVTRYIEVGQAEGATLLTGGDRPDADALEDGWFVTPTVFGDVDSDMRIVNEEIFGPVQTIDTFSTYAEAIELANDTEFGLAAGIGTERTNRVHKTAADLEAGIVYVNDYGPILPDAPYGGFKESGIGRDLGLEALDHYRQSKTVYVNLDEPAF
ncbi:MAG: aldehyde dehydrogenase [Halobacteriales archaeon]